MHIRCPHCHNPIDVVDETSFTEISCPSCGSSFSMISGDTTQTHRTESRRLAHFELVRELGIGKFGSVWMAHDTELDRTVAIKIPRKEALDPDECELFLRDARAAAQLKHPNIVAVHEVGREQGTVYIVSDYVDGANLKEWLSGQRLSSRESVELVVKVAEALEHAHQAGVVHRDLKPGNIMIDRDGEPHVIDFGLAKREAGEITMTVEGHILGTPAYMSPEQARGKGHDADARSDVYSLGVILFELLTSELPFRGEAQMLLLQIQRDEPPRPRKLNAKIPRDLETITLKCLDKVPARRYQTAKQLAEDLQRWLEGRPIVARPIGRAARSWRWVKRNRAAAALAALVVLNVVGGILLAALVIVFDARDQERAAKQQAIVDRDLAIKARGIAEEAREQEVVQKNKAIAAEVMARQAQEEERKQKLIAVAEERKAVIAMQGEERAAQDSRFHADLFAALLASAERGVAWDKNNPTISVVLGAAQYRAGHYKEARTTLLGAQNKLRLAALAAPDHLAEIRLFQLLSEMFLMMACHKLEENDELHTAAVRVEALIGEIEKMELPSDPLPAPWSRKFCVEMAQRELDRVKGN